MTRENVARLLVALVFGVMLLVAIDEATVSGKPGDRPSWAFLAVLCALVLVVNGRVRWKR